MKNNLTRVNISGTIYYDNGIIFENSICKIQVALPLCLDDWDSCNALAPSSATCSELIHSGNWGLKLFLKDDGEGWFGFQTSYQPEKIIFLLQNVLPQSIFKSSASLLNAESESSVIGLPSVFLLSGAWLLSISIQISPHEQNISECPPQFVTELFA